MTRDPHPWSRAWSDLCADLDRYAVTDGRPTVVNLWLSPGSVASVHYRVAHWVWSGPGLALRGLRLPLLVLQRLVEVWTGIAISPQAVIGPGLYVGHFGNVLVHGDAVLGANVNLSQGVSIGIAGRGSRRGVPTLGDRVHVAAGAVVVGPVVVGDDAAIGANAVVSKDVDPRAVVGGVPARVLGREGSFDFVLYRGMETDPGRVRSQTQVS